MADWKLYEQFVTRLISEDVDQNLTVVPNARLNGVLSGTSRQIDLLIDYRYGEDASRRIIVDAKRLNRRIDVKHVEEFEGMMRDVRANHGIIVCPSGYSQAALRRAQDTISIRLVPLSDLDGLDLTEWEECYHPGCDKGYILWDASPGLTVNNGPVCIFRTGKCDMCHAFHVWCWGCGERFALNDEDDHQCWCKDAWFWLTCIEEDESGPSTRRQAAYLLLVLGTGEYFPIDRRPRS